MSELLKAIAETAQHLEKAYEANRQLQQRITELEAWQGEPVAEVTGKIGSLLDMVTIKFYSSVMPEPGTKLYTSAPRIPDGWQPVPKEPTKGEICDCNA